jgi:hypothetical protein
VSDPPEKPSPAEQWVEAIDLEAPAKSAAGAWLRLVVTAGSLLLLYVVLRQSTATMLVKDSSVPLNGDTYEDHRFGLRLETRKAIFRELATVELAERARALSVNSWNGHLWSREDDRGHYEMTAALRLSKQYKTSLTQVYMILDEGIREHWPAPNGEPLPATTPPQDPRSTW